MEGKGWRAGGNDGELAGMMCGFVSEKGEANVRWGGRCAPLPALTWEVASPTHCCQPQPAPPPHPNSTLRKHCATTAWSGSCDAFVEAKFAGQKKTSKVPAGPRVRPRIGSQSAVGKAGEA